MSGPRLIGGSPCVACCPASPPYPCWPSSRPKLSSTACSRRNGRSSRWPRCAANSWCWPPAAEDERYNSFIRKYQADLMGNERAVGDVFKRMYGKRAQQEHDRFTTDLANGESSAGMHLGTDFCARNSVIFSEVMALRSAAELPAYAKGKDLVPATVDLCPQVAQAPAHRQAAASKNH